MTHRNPKATLLVLLLCVGRAASRTWVHPGVLVGEAALQAAALDAASGAEPVASALAKALSSPLLVPGGVPVGQKWTDTGAVHCGSVSNPDFGCSQENANASAAYLRLLLWRLTGDTQHARLAGETMAAYASGVLAYTGSNACLQVAWGASKWARCAELARWPAPAPGWSEEKGAVFARWLASVHGPHLVSCTDSWAPGGNWGLSQAEALAGVAVATEDEALWERSQALLHARASAYVYSYALDGGADGPPPRPDRAGAGWGHGGGEHGWLRGWFGQSVFAAPSDGVAQETCRDLGHTLYGLAAASNAAETAWLQGDGGAAWGLLAPRLGPALELHAALELELGGDRPPPRRPWLCGGRAVALGDAVTLRPRYPTLEVARAALAGRLGLRMPNTEAYVAAVTRADPHPVDTGKSVGHMIVFESLTHGSGRLGAAAPGPPLLAPLPPSPGARFCLPAGGEGDGACYSVHSPFSTTVMANQLGGGVTLLLQTSPTKLRMVRAALGVWRGPASVALFARDPAEGAALRSSFRCASCVVSHVEAAGAPGAAAPAYPINLLRQLAVEAAPTDLCLVLDADFLPSLPTYAALRSPAAVPSPLPPRSAYVVPALEQRDPAAVAPLFGMAPLRAAVRANATGEFHALSYPAGHARTRTAEWLEAGGPYELAAGQSQAAREDTLRKHDPFVLFSRSDPALPPFNPLFVNRGGNKAAWARGLREAGYRFTVLPGAWAVHVWEADPARLPFMPKPRQAAARAVGPALAWRDGWRAGAAAAAAPGARAARF